ncbi:MAG: polymer-forming cytoskeletal protein [Proteobacteria bacterium]|nr:polymer-forming cytoskeletal protein [Pseudomonadota bacterium]
MMSKKPATKMSKGATLIAENTQVLGDVCFSDQLYVNGHIEGNVLAEEGSEAALMISDVGSVKGRIAVPFVVVNGRVEGDVHAGVRVELAAHAKVSGNVYYKLIEMQLGAKVDGQLLHVADEPSIKTNVHALPRAKEDGR